MVKRLILLMGLAFLNLSLAAGILVGRVNGSDALIALVANGNELLAYVCGGPADWQTHTSWFKGDLSANGSFSLNTDNLWLNGTILGQAARGVLELADGSRLSWQALSPQKDSPAGLYRMADSEAVTGFIVNNELESVGSIRLIKPNAQALVLPVFLKGSLPAETITGVDVCYSNEGQESCLFTPRFE